MKELMEIARLRAQAVRRLEAIAEENGSFTMDEVLAAIDAAVAQA